MNVQPRLGAQRATQQLKAVAPSEVADAERFDLDAFVENFDVLANASTGVTRLRELILDLATRGLLCAQLESDEPADAMLDRIRQAQVRAEKSGDIDRVPPSAPITTEEQPHRLRRGWAWTRLQAGVLTIQIGPFGSLLHQSDYVSGGTPIVNPAHIKDGRVVVNGERFPS